MSLTLREHQPYWCSCGRVLHGNGGWVSHKTAHRRQSEKFTELTREQYLAEFPDRDARGKKKPS
jgi:hypothetical protein